MDDSTEGSGNPLDAVFEKAVRPYTGAAALREAFPADTPVIVMHKRDDVPTETRTTEGGGTITIPVLAALKDASVATKSRVGTYDFDAMDPDAVALVLPRGEAGAVQVRVVTRAKGGALLAADLDGMLDAVVALADNPAIRAFPGGEFLIDALRTGLAQAKADLSESLTKPDASGRSVLDQISEEPAPGHAHKAAGKTPRARN